MNANNERWLKRHARTIADAYKKPADADGKRRVYMYGRRTQLKKSQTFCRYSMGVTPLRKPSRRRCRRDKNLS